MVVLRTAGPAFYDSWIRHDVPFDHPHVVESIRTIGAMVHRPGFLDTSPTVTALRDYRDGLVVAFNRQPPACLMSPAPSYMPGVLGADTELNAATFPFPGFGEGFDDAIVGGGGMLVPVADRPEIRTFMAAIASPDWGAGAAQLDWPLLLPVNARFDTASMAQPEMAEIVEGIQAAIRTDSFRYDASDSMPPGVEQAFRDGMLRIFREGSPDNIDQLSLEVARDVEAVWPD
jgi:alpha-glucoside transport system substrate-binding protein